SCRRAYQGSRPSQAYRLHGAAGSRCASLAPRRPFLGGLAKRIFAVRNRFYLSITIPPALDKQAITESRTMRSLASNGIISPVVFTAIRCSRRVKLWNRQASIIRDLTTLALRHEERCLPRV